MNCESIAQDVDFLLQNPGDRDVYNRLEKHFKECEKCREELGDIINTAAKISEVGQISDIVDVSEEFVEKTREEAKKESERFQLSSGKLKSKKEMSRMVDYLIIGLIIGTVIAALIVFYLAIINL